MKNKKKKQPVATKLPSPELKKEVDRICHRLCGTPDSSVIDLSICETMKKVADQRLFEKAADGSILYKTYDDFVKAVVVQIRARLRQDKKRPLKSGYKRINEAVTYNRVAFIDGVPPPTTRAQLQTLAKCDEAIQADVWRTAVINAAGQKITRLIVTQAARQHGVVIPEPDPSASMILARIRGLWLRVQRTIVVPPTEQAKLDEFVTALDVSAVGEAVEFFPENSESNVSTAPLPPAVNPPSSIDVDGALPQTAPRKKIAGKAEVGLWIDGGNLVMKFKNKDESIRVRAVIDLGVTGFALQRDRMLWLREIKDRSNPQADCDAFTTTLVEVGATVVGK